MPMRATNLATYLFTRLRQRGVGHMHGVPGDYGLRSLDYLAPANLKWVGNCNELNAGYAADGYARIKGVGALMTTYGVGELSAINAIAGSYAEHVPVVHIVATPARQLQNARAMIHHYLGDGSPRVYAEMSEKVTVAQANLVDAEKAPEMIDQVIQQCLIHSRPAYIELPADMVSATVSAERLDKPLSSTLDANEDIESIQVQKLLQNLYSSKRPLLLVDRGWGVSHILEEIKELVHISGLPTLAMPSGQGMVETTTPNYYGLHSGPAGYINTMTYINTSDLILAFGPMFSNTQTLGWQTVPDPNLTTTVRKNSISYPTSLSPVPINAKSFMHKLLSLLDPSALPKPDTRALSNFRSRPPFTLHNSNPNAPIMQDGLYDRLATYLQPHDILLLANGTPLLGARDLLLPAHTTVIASGLWFSIGQMLPAAQGAALAQQDSPTMPPTAVGNGEHDGAKRRTPRTVIFEGDGSFQVSAQELSTIIKLRLDVTVFIINNEGYAYERLIHGAEEAYNDVLPWRYCELASAFGAPRGSEKEEGGEEDEYTVLSRRVSTWRELNALLGDEKWAGAKGLKVLDIVVGKTDVPGRFKAYFESRVG